MVPSILIVDDERELLHALTVRLTAAGFVCDTAMNGKEGLAKVQQRRPDLIVVDLLMPEMDGFEMCRRLKSDAATTSIPVLVLTAIPERSLEERLHELGTVRVMHKPFDSMELLSAVREILAVTPPGGHDHG